MGRHSRPNHPSRPLKIFYISKAAGGLGGAGGFACHPALNHGRRSCERTSPADTAFVRQLTHLFALRPHSRNGNGRTAKTALDNAPAPDEQELKNEELDEVTGGSSGAAGTGPTPHH
jgi:hypothetical protein